ncbi:DUF177 domain-containing protein [Streptomyces sp. HNM0574]|uniref:YceD family protein n=1 Tax=Streptomyces sp. HNM0574 TaxID=2714954 RepID=UPI00146E2427|nr:DUF177 domain-containing protein [Streptomyces sp. HNM0574]NLU69775.1 DUF177 domain-containing protein [Streptomyces sp. HNM0574]
MKRLSRTVDSPGDLGTEVIAVPDDASIEIELRLESVMEGVLVTGTAHAPLKGECVRCLEPLSQECEVEFQEMFSYPDADDRSHENVDTGDDAEEEGPLYLEDDLFDLEPVLRDAVVLSLPLQPVCREDCPGLCPDCGARLADDPDHHHEEAVDIRWAALQELASSMKDDEKDVPRDGGDDSQEK